MKKLYWLITIIGRSDIEEYETFYLGHGVKLLYSIPCSGTAQEKTLSLLGVERTEKSMLFAPLAGEKLAAVMRGLTVEMKIDLPNRGVAIAIPVSGIGGARALDQLMGEQSTVEQQKENDMESGYELIVAICERGHTGQVMDAAREAGAGGGTTFRAKGTAADAEKFFGIALAEEKEIIFIVSTTEKKKDIMKAIMQKAGIDSKAHALTFSLPVSETAGFRFSDTVDKEQEA